ncbi:class I adenylate-forming enzyme family protein [Zwartia vadi]|uniref:class I adenylate-forming enzyme family protein n=1 Tax=Zwartia vadi TaxID=3058168 RepID=UPI0025B3CCFF|nr:AMP-binding protein [Zwartia vadi]MDN3987627.1 AMP-binding protein [Zwartia vadi]
MKSPLAVLNTYRPHNGTLHDAFASRCEVKGQAAFIIQNEQSISWSEFERDYKKLAQAFHQKGVGHGMRVAIMGKNDAAHVLTLFALAYLGAIMVPVNPEFGERETSYVLKHAEVCGVIADTSVIPLVQSALNKLDISPWLLRLDAHVEDEDGLKGAIASSCAAQYPPHGQASDTCIIIYTSGTTGFPKGVMHSQFNLVTAGEANVERLHLQPEDRVLIILPFFHVNAVFYSLSGVLASGSCMILVPRFSASTFWQIAADQGATVVNVIEAIGSILCARDRSEYRPDHKLRAAYGVRKGAAPVFRQEFGIHKLFSGFGMTEIPGVTCNPWEGPDKPGSMGLPGRHPDPSRPWARCRVVDDEGKDVPVGIAGELWVKTPIVMQGYFRDPEQTQQAFQDGWLKTGDLVKVDEDGYYYHLSRKKDIIRRRGENIAAAELEMVIAELPGIYQVAAIAVPSELGEDDILIAAVKKPGASLSEQDVIDWCRERLAAVKVPRFVCFLQELPLTPTHKILKTALRADPNVRAKAIDFQSSTQR